MPCFACTSKPSLLWNKRHGLFTMWKKQSNIIIYSYLGLSFTPLYSIAISFTPLALLSVSLCVKASIISHYPYCMISALHLVNSFMLVWNLFGLDNKSRIFICLCFEIHQQPIELAVAWPVMVNQPRPFPHTNEWHLQTLYVKDYQFGDYVQIWLLSFTLVSCLSRPVSELTSTQCTFCSCNLNVLCKAMGFTETMDNKYSTI